MNLVRKRGPLSTRRWSFGRRDRTSWSAIESGPLLNLAELQAVEATGFAADYDDVVEEDEIVILQVRPSPLWIPLSCLAGLAVIALLTLILVQLAPWVGQWPGLSWTPAGGIAFGIVLAAARLGWQALEWWSLMYVLTDRRVVRRGGVLRVSIVQADLRNVQHTSLFVRLRERPFGLGSIGFATAGTAAYEMFWVTLRRPHEVHRTVIQTIDRYGHHGHEAPGASSETP